MKVYSFEKLECWQQARQLAVWTYKTTKNFPAEEKFGPYITNAQSKYFRSFKYCRRHIT